MLWKLCRAGRVVKEGFGIARRLGVLGESKFERNLYSTARNHNRED